MIRAPNAIRNGFATFLVSLGNRETYFVSNSSLGIRSAIGCLKSKNECCDLSIGLYMFFPLSGMIYHKICKKIDLILPKPLQILYQILGKKSVKSRDLAIADLNKGDFITPPSRLSIFEKGNGGLKL